VGRPAEGRSDRGRAASTGRGCGRGAPQRCPRRAPGTFPPGPRSLVPDPAPALTLSAANPRYVALPLAARPLTLTLTLPLTVPLTRQNGGW